MTASLHRLWIALAGLAGCSAVDLSAWAAHGAPAVLAPPQLASLERALGLQGWHAAALLAAGLWAERRGGLAHWACGLLALGLLLFCGAVYAGAFGLRFGPVAPVGGSTLMLGWLLLAASALRPARPAGAGTHGIAPAGRPGGTP